MTLKPEPLLTPGQVARLFNVDPKTVTRWLKNGKLRAIRTPGGHYMYPEADVLPHLKYVDLTAENSGDEL